MATADDLSPRSLGTRRLTLTLSAETQVLAAFRPLTVDVDYSAAAPEGVVLPLEMTIVGPRGATERSPRFFARHFYRRTRPSSLTFIPTEGGDYLVRVAEVGHNRWWGALALSVTGDDLRLQLRARAS